MPLPLCRRLAQGGEIPLVDDHEVGVTGGFGVVRGIWCRSGVPPPADARLQA